MKSIQKYLQQASLRKCRQGLTIKITLGRTTEHRQIQSSMRALRYYQTNWSETLFKALTWVSTLYQQPIHNLPWLTIEKRSNLNLKISMNNLHYNIEEGCSQVKISFYWQLKGNKWTLTLSWTKCFIRPLDKVLSLPRLTNWEMKYHFTNRQPLPQHHNSKSHSWILNMEVAASQNLVNDK